MAEPRPKRKIIIIPAKKESPQEQAKKRNLRVAAYCRVSTGDEEQLTSYENQKAFYTEKIMKNPDWTMVDIFADEGITGTSTCRRKQFLRMIRQCRQGKIDMILAKSVSRFARNTLDTISYTRELRGLGIAVIFEEQNINSIYPESEFLIALHAAFAQSESESISANVRWGKRQSIKDGKVTEMTAPADAKVQRIKISSCGLSVYYSADAAFDYSNAVFFVNGKDQGIGAMHSMTDTANIYLMYRSISDYIPLDKLNTLEFSVKSNQD